MGFPAYRFVDKDHEEFTCLVCNGVAINPLIIDKCEHVCCASCLTGITGCPQCKISFAYSKPMKLDGFLKLVYESLEMKCRNSSCMTILPMEAMMIHDVTCDVTFLNCPCCGMKVRRQALFMHQCSNRETDNYKLYE